VAESVKVDADAFTAAIRALLNTPPEKMADIPRKREPRAQKPRPKRKRKREPRAQKPRPKRKRKRA
jgi:hypothetical protein